MSDRDEGRGELEKRLIERADYLAVQGYGMTSHDVREAAAVLGECRRAMEAARKLIAGLTPMGSSSSGIELSAEQEAMADGCDEVREQIAAALAKLGEGG